MIKSDIGEISVGIFAVLSIILCPCLAVTILSQSRMTDSRHSGLRPLILIRMHGIGHKLINAIMPIVTHVV